MERTGNNNLYDTINSQSKQWNSQSKHKCENALLPDLQVQRLRRLEVRRPLGSLIDAGVLLLLSGNHLQNRNGEVLQMRFRFVGIFHTYTSTLVSILIPECRLWAAMVAGHASLARLENAEDGGRASSQPLRARRCQLA